MIDLSPFCSKEELRPFLHTPFSHGEWTYATNGHIAIRVPRRSDMPGDSNAPGEKIEAMFAAAGNLEMRPMPRFEWPPRETSDCSACEGRGTAHTCPNCECPCQRCDGSGISGSVVSGNLGPAIFDAKYLILLMKLPEAEVPSEPSTTEPMPFIFTGGCGLLMPRRVESLKHVADPGR